MMENASSFVANKSAPFGKRVSNGDAYASVIF